jgi:hypothetical protein
MGFGFKAKASVDAPPMGLRQIRAARLRAEREGGSVPSVAPHGDHERGTPRPPARSNQARAFAGARRGQQSGAAVPPSHADRHVEPGATGTRADNGGDEAGRTECGPAGTGNHVVREGECIASIAEDAGHDWEYLWNHADNAALRAARSDPHMLLPGDRVAIPPIETREETCETELRHRFRQNRSGVLRLVVVDGDAPRGNQPFTLRYDDREFTGVTDAEGKLEAPLSPCAQSAVLTVGEGAEAEDYELDLGTLHPIESVRGVQARLRNLGYPIATIDGTLNADTQGAIKRFRVDHGLDSSPESGLDETLRNTLREVHGF